MKLKSFNNDQFQRGRVVWVEALWAIVSALFVSTWMPGSFWRVALLRAFGAKVGRGVIIKPRVRIKFPWKLAISDDCWIGESVWIDNLDYVRVGSNCCISQGVYLCTGNHNWSKQSFDLITAPIVIDRCSWIGAFSVVVGGVTIQCGTVCLVGSIVRVSTGSWEIWSGNPAMKVKDRIVN